MEVEESGREKIHSVCLLGLNIQMLMVFVRSIYLGDGIAREIYF